MEKELDWDAAEKHLVLVEDACKATIGMPGVNLGFMVGIINTLRNRFSGGERTEDLFNEIMELPI